MQTALDRLLIPHAVIFAAHDQREACQSEDDSPCSLLSVQPQQGRCWRKMLCLKTSSQRRSAPGAIPAWRVHCLGWRNCRALGNCGRGSDNGARSDDLPALAPRGERRHRPASSDAVVEAIPLSEASPEALREAPVPSMAKTTRALPFRATRVPVCRSVSSGRASRSARKRVRQGSVDARAHARKKAREGRGGGQSHAARTGP